MSELASAPHFVYRLYGADGAVLYAGCTHDVTRRLKGHAATQPWWLEVAWHAAEGPFTRTDGLARECAAIRAERPRYNVRDNPTPPTRREFSEESIAYVMAATGFPRIGIVQHMWVGRLPSHDVTRADVYRWLDGLPTSRPQQPHTVGVAAA